MSNICSGRTPNPIGGKCQVDFFFFFLDLFLPSIAEPFVKQERLFGPAQITWFRVGDFNPSIEANLLGVSES